MNDRKEIKYQHRNVLYYYCGRGMFWFRIFGKGLHFRNINKHPLVFSERNGYTKYLLIGNIVIKVLK